MSFLGFGLTESEKKRFEEFQKNRRSSMRVIGRGTLTMSLEDARAARREMIKRESRNKNDAENNAAITP